MHADIPALIGLLIAPLEVFAVRYDQLAEDARLAAAAQLFVSYLRLAATETAAAALGSKLAAFAAEPQVGMRVHHMHGVGRDLARILARLGQLRPAFEHLGLEFDMAAMDRLTAEVSQMRQNLQATQSPDPLQFPSQGVIQSAQAALAPLPAQLADITGKLGQIVSRHPARGQKVRWQAPTAASDPPMASDMGVDYTALRDLLAAGS